MLESLLSHHAVQSLTRALQDSPWAGQLWLVGGCVRDTLLGRPLKNDFDLVLEGDAVAVTEWLWAHKRCDFPPVQYPRFGTAMAHIGRSQFEFVSARKESYDEDSRKPHVSGATLLDDAQRRDFTCNTLMVNLHSGELLDLIGTGLEDLRSGLLRTPLDPRQTFFDDPLRMLRAVRFKTQLGFAYDDDLKAALFEERERLEVISAERIREEFSKILTLPNATEGLRDLMEFQLMPWIIPELEAMVGVTQGKWHHLDVWEHTLLVIENANSDDLTLALACLLHDIAKPATRSVDSERQIRFFSHEVVGASMSREILQRLRYSNDVIEDVSLLVKNHMRLSSAAELSKPATRRLIRDLNDQLDRLILLVDADAKALKPGVKALDIESIRTRIEAVRIETPAEKLRSPLTGDEVMELLGLEPGPQVGKAMQFLTDRVIEGELLPDDKELAEQLLVEWFEG